MYLKSLEMTNFRKYREENNIIEFTDSESYERVITADDSSAVNIAETVSLIVGKNNAGKTTIIEAMKLLINGGDIGSNDFNIEYLSEICNEYKANSYDRFPNFELKLVIGLDKGMNTSLLGNLADFLSISGVNEDKAIIIARFEVVEEATFENIVREEFAKGKENLHFKPLNKLMQIIDSNEKLFSLNFYDCNGNKKKDFKAKHLITYVPIQVCDIESGTALTKAFNKIIKYRYEHTFKDNKNSIENSLAEINEDLTNEITNTHTNGINASLQKIIPGNVMKVGLYADITFEKLMDNLLRYDYIENEKHIPENQFGLGYANLIMIIAAIIDYIERYPNTAFNGKLNLISIEEPECHMHPQMQELFIQYINDAINTLLDIKEKNAANQIIITTHSSHIVNSKVQSGNTLNNINYITTKNGCSCVKTLTDDNVIPLNNNVEQFTFIKKHMKFGISDALFADALIIVEGMTEEALIPYYLAKDPDLKHLYIKVVKIDGAHAFVYHNFLKQIGIPTAIITDLDIERDKSEKKYYSLISDPTSKITTNNTIKYFAKANGIKSDAISVLEANNPILCDNIKVFFQFKDYGLYRTSFEEDFISTNYMNKMVNEVLKDMRPELHERIVGKTGNENYLLNKLCAYHWQRSLEGAKGEFASNILYSILANEDNPNFDMPSLPKYILDAFDYIKNSLGV